MARGGHIGGSIGEDLPVAVRRAIARARQRPPGYEVSVPGVSPVSSLVGARDHFEPRAPKWGPRCLGCLAPLANGRPVCSDACDDLAWNLCPTADGEVWAGRG